MPANNPNKEEYAKAVCFFISELLRTHKISLTRAAEIGQKVLAHLNLIDTEQDFLKFIKELTSDFEELLQLHQIVLYRIAGNQRQQMENTIREFVISIMPNDMPQALEVLAAAIEEHAQLPDLCTRFPELKQFIGLKT